MYIKLCSLFSGSSGNSTYIGTDKTHILVDSGLSGVKVKKALKCVGVEPSDLDAIVITHEHTDHVRVLVFYLRNLIYPYMQMKRHGRLWMGKLGIYLLRI